MVKSIERYVLKLVDYLQNNNLIVPIWKEMYYGIKAGHYERQLEKRIPEGWKYERINRKMQEALIMESAFARLRNDSRKADRIIQKLADENVKNAQEKLRRSSHYNI